MFELSENNRFFFFPEPVNMGYGIDGLSKQVCAHPALSLVSGDIFVFFSRDRKRIKLLRWDGDSFILYYKRLTRAHSTSRVIARKKACTSSTGTRFIS